MLKLREYRIHGPRFVEHISHVACALTATSQWGAAKVQSEPFGRDGGLSTRQVLNALQRDDDVGPLEDGGRT